MGYHWLAPLTAALVTLILGAVVFRHGPRRELNQSFAFFSVMLSLWNANFFVLYFVSDYDWAWALTRILRPAAIFLQPAILHLAGIQSGRLAVDSPSFAPNWYRLVVFDYTIASGLTLANAFDLIVSRLALAPWGYSSVGTSLYVVFSVFVLANAAATVATLFMDYRTSKVPQVRLQLRFWLFGAGLALPLGLSNLFPTYGIPIYPLGALGTVLWAAIVAYAMIRHRLMGLDLVLSKTAAHVVTFLLLVLPSVMMLLWVQELTLGSVNPELTSFTLISLMCAVILAPRILPELEARIRQSLFPDRIAYRSLLATFGKDIVRILDEPTLLRHIGNTLASTLSVERIAIYRHDPPAHIYVPIYGLGDNQPPPIRDSSSLIRALGARSHATLRSEFSLDDHADAAQILDSQRWEVCVPLTSQRQTPQGFLAIGRKRNLEAFVSEDLELLDALAGETAIALENARLYAELQRSNDLIQRADRSSSLGVLAAGIAHEIRNPLVSIQTFFQLAPDRLGDTEFMTSFLDTAAGEVKRISKLISEILSFARSPTPMMIETNLNEAVEGVLTLVGPEARKHRVRLRCEVALEAPSPVANPEQIRQVLLNLVFNAIQASRSGGDVLVFTRSIQERGRCYGQIEVRDFGSGITREHLAHIFDPFYTTKEKGTGLGLAIARQIVSEHGGRISVHSDTGKMTSFFVDLPMARPPSDNGDSP